MDLKETLHELDTLANPKNVVGMKRFGINGKNMLGISVTTLRGVARKIKTDHELSKGLWETGIHEARLLSCLVADVNQLESEEMDSMIADFDSWDICDMACCSLFWHHQSAYQKVFEWAKHEPEYERRAAFALIAGYAWHQKHATDEHLATFFPVIEQYSFDGRNFVKKAVNWALRQIGKRNENLAKQAVVCARRILDQATKPAVWIARDAIRELLVKFPSVDNTL